MLVGGNGRMKRKETNTCCTDSHLFINGMRHGWYRKGILPTLLLKNRADWEIMVPGISVCAGISGAASVRLVC